MEHHIKFAMSFLDITDIPKLTRYIIIDLFRQ